MVIEIHYGWCFLNSPDFRISQNGCNDHILTTNVKLLKVWKGYYEKQMLVSIKFMHMKHTFNVHVVNSRVWACFCFAFSKLSISTRLTSCRPWRWGRSSRPIHGPWAGTSPGHPCRAPALCGSASCTWYHGGCRTGLPASARGKWGMEEVHWFLSVLYIDDGIWRVYLQQRQLQQLLYSMSANTLRISIVNYIRLVRGIDLILFFNFWYIYDILFFTLLLIIGGLQAKLY